MAQVVIVGASLAGATAAHAIRGAGFEGELVLVGDEPHSPYNRPPLSKELLLGGKTAEETAIYTAEELAGLDLELRSGEAAVALDGERRRVELASGEEVSFDGLIIATGARPRRLPFQPGDAGIHELRSLDDALALADALESARRVLVVGAGFIGLEVASAALGRGKEVTVLEAAALPMGDLLGTAIGFELAALHRGEGVDLRCGEAVSDFILEDGRAVGVALAGGERLGPDALLVGVGARPNVEWLASSGISLADGVCCDGALRVAPGIYAAGDVARFDHPALGAIRVEHWTSAADQGRRAARNLARELAGRSDRELCDAIPYFWSDQLGTRIQLAGHLRGGEKALCLREGTRLLSLFARDGLLVAVMAWNWPKALALGRGWIKDGASWDEGLARAESLFADLSPRGAVEALT